MRRPQARSGERDAGGSAIAPRRVVWRSKRAGAVVSAGWGRRTPGAGATMSVPCQFMAPMRVQKQLEASRPSPSHPWSGNAPAGGSPPAWSTSPPPEPPPPHGHCVGDNTRLASLPKHQNNPSQLDSEGSCVRQIGIRCSPNKENQAEAFDAGRTGPSSAFLKLDRAGNGNACERWCHDRNSLRNL